jgi:acetyl esterase/lipase
MTMKYAKVTLLALSVTAAIFSTSPLLAAAPAAAPAGGGRGAGAGAGGGGGGRGGNPEWRADDLAFPGRAVIAEKEAKIPEAVLLWPKGAPNAQGDSDEDKPALYPFLPAKEKNTGCAVIVAPGGAFTHRAMDYEGVTWAKWLADRGIAAFVLRYRLSPLYQRPDYTLDAQRSVQFLRAHASDYNISGDRVGMIGFSAGSELAAMIAFRTLPAAPDSQDVVERQASNLNFMILGYGSSAGTVNRATFPPTFMFCTTEDKSHATGMINLYWDLYNANVPAEIHLFPNGEHGVGLAAGDRVLGQWPDLLYNWMRASNFLTGEKRAAVSGHVILDGKPLPHGSITFVPVIGPETKGTPAPLTAFIMNTDTPTADFKLSANVGPVPGKYHVEVRQDGGVWVSNNRLDALRLAPADKAAFLRTPGWGLATIDNIHLFTKTHPTDKDDLTIEVKPGDNTYNIEVFSK